MHGDRDHERCPKCIGGVIQTGICNRCGVILERYLQALSRRTAIREKYSSDRPLCKVRGSMLGIGRAYVILGVVLILIAGIVLVSNNLAAQKKSYHEIGQEIEGMVEAFQYDGARELIRESFDGEDQRTIKWLKSIDDREALSFSLRDGKRFFNEALISSGRQDIIGAAQKFKKALNSFSRLKDKRLIALTNLNLGVCYRMLRKNQDALTVLNTTVNISRENDFNRYEARAFREMGVMYSYLGQHEKGLFFLEEALALHMTLDDKKEEILDCLMMAVLENEYNSLLAEAYFQRALELSSRIDDHSLQFKISSLQGLWKKGGTERIKLINKLSSLENL